MAEEEEEEAAWDRGGRARRQTACNSLSLSLPPLLHCCFGGGEGDMGIALKRGGGGRPRRGARHERRWGGDRRGGESCIPPPPLLQAAAARGKRGTVGLFWREYTHYTHTLAARKKVKTWPYSLPPFLFPLLSGGVVRATLSIGPSIDDGGET